MTIDDQPPPAQNTGHPPTWPIVIANIRSTFDAIPKDLRDAGCDAELCAAIVADMETRDRIGRERYGTPLAPFNGRDHLVDAYQELLDAAVYLRNWLEEHGPGRSPIEEIYAVTLSSIMRLRFLIKTRP
jgi:hypothetical protein